MNLLLDMVEDIRLLVANAWGYRIELMNIKLINHSLSELNFDVFRILWGFSFFVLLSTLC